MSAAKPHPLGAAKNPQPQHAEVHAPAQPPAAWFCSSCMPAAADDQEAPVCCLKSLWDAACNLVTSLIKSLTGEAAANGAVVAVPAAPNGPQQPTQSQQKCAAFVAKWRNRPGSQADWEAEIPKLPPPVRGHLHDAFISQCHAQIVWPAERKDANAVYTVQERAAIKHAINHAVAHPVILSAVETWAPPAAG